MVLADNAELAEDAAQAVGLDIEPLPVVADRRASMRNNVRVIDGTESNCATVYAANAGDVERTFRNAAYTRREQFRVQRMTAMTMETRGLLAEWDATAERLTVSGGAKLPFRDDGTFRGDRRLYRVRRRWRFWRARRILSGGFSGRLCRPQVRPPGEMD